MPDTMLLVQMLVMLLVIGGFAGVLAGLLGVGAAASYWCPRFSMPFRPLAMAATQLMQMCLATSLATIIVTSRYARFSSHNKKGAVDWAILRRLGTRASLHWRGGGRAGGGLIFTVR